MVESTAIHPQARAGPWPIKGLAAEHQKLQKLGRNWTLPTARLITGRQACGLVPRPVEEPTQ
jgi:hypothetical protein